MSFRRLLDLAFILVSACTMPALADRQQFAGTWEAKFKGDVFMRLTLQADDGITGTLSGGHLEVNNDGDITEASGGGEERPISNTKLQGTDKLTFDVKDSDDETMKFVLTLTGDGAELQFMNVPEGMKMKPVRLTRR